MNTKSNEQDFYVVAKELVAVDNSTNGTKEYYEMLNSPLGFLVSCIPLYLSLLLAWNDSIWKTIWLLLHFAVSALICCVFNLEHSKGTSKAIVIITLTAIFLIERFTKFQIFSSQKIFVFVYSFVGLAIYSIWWGSKYIPEVNKKNKEIKRCERKARSLMNKLKCFEDDKRKFYWWDSRIVNNSEPKWHYSVFGQTESVSGSDINIKSREDKSYYITTKRADKSDYSKIMTSIGKGSKVLFGSKKMITRIEDSDVVYNIFLMETTDEHFDVTTWESVSEEDIENYSRAYNRKKDNLERLVNSTHLTDKENFQVSMLTDTDNETRMYYLEQDLLSDIDRKNAREQYASSIKNVSNRTSSHKYDRRYIIGYIIGDTLVVVEQDKEKKAIIEKLYDSLLYRYAHSGLQVIEYFRKNITTGYDTRQEADIASYIAHNPLTFEI